MAFTEFYVTKGTSAADTNGGGPRLGANDGPTYSLTGGAGAGATAVDNGTESDITDLNSGDWGDTQVDDVLCFDTGGAKQFTMVMAIDVGADTNVIKVWPMVTAAADKSCSDCGAWATVDHAASLVEPVAFANTGGDPIRVNIGPGTYAEAAGVTIDNAGTASSYLTFEGYYATVGDEAMNGATFSPPVIEGPASGSSAGTVYAATGKDFHRVRNLKITAQQDNIEAVNTASSSSVYERLWLLTTGSAADAYQNPGNGGYNLIRDVYVEAATGNGISVYAYDRVIGCYIQQSTDSGIKPDGRGCLVEDCIIEGQTTDCITVTAGGDAVTIRNCTLYNSSGGSGVYIASGADNLLIENTIFDTMNQYGIEAAAAVTVTERYNSFRACTQGVRDTNVISDPVGNTTHSGDPFTNAAGHDFSLDATAGEGAALRNAGWPGTLLDGTNVGYADIGALRHEDAGGATTPVAVEYVIEGHDNYVGGDAGTYHPTLVAEVLDTVSFGAASAETGTYHAPGVAEVIDSAVFGAASGESGTVHLPDVAEVISTATFGAASGSTGTYHAPEVAEVISTATFGAASAETGTYHAPEVSEVIDTATFGAASAETGTIHQPEAAEVLDSAVFGAASAVPGTYHAPGVAEVVDTAVFGAASVEAGTVHLPEVGEVISTAAFGPASGSTGTYHVCAVAEVLSTVSFGAGSAQTGTYHAPDAAEVISTAVFGVASGTSGTYDVTEVVDTNILVGASIGGVAGAEIGATAQLATDAAAVFAELANMTTDVVNLLDAANDGTLNMSLWIEKSAVVAADWVVTGHDNYTGGSGGTYPTTATSFAGGQADQLAADAVLIEAQAAKIISVDFTGGLGTHGNLTLPDVKYLYNAIDRGDGTTGTLRASNLHSGAGAPGVDLSAAILEDGVTVDDVLGTLGGSSAVWPDESNVSTAETAWGPTGAEYAGELDLSLYRLITPATGEMAGYEKKVERRSGRMRGHFWNSRVYEVPFNSIPALPLPGAYFPGETTGPRVLEDGVTTSPVIAKGQSEPTNLRITIVAGGPLYATSDGGGETFTYGL